MTFIFRSGGVRTPFTTEDGGAPVYAEAMTGGAGAGARRAPFGTAGAFAAFVSFGVSRGFGGVAGGVSPKQGMATATASRRKRETAGIG